MLYKHSLLLFKILRKRLLVLKNILKRFYEKNNLLYSFYALLEARKNICVNLN